MTSLLGEVLAAHGVDVGDVKEVIRAMESRRPVVVDVA